MNYEQAVEALQDGKVVEVFITEQTCKLKPSDMDVPDVELVGPSPDQSKNERTVMSLSVFGNLHNFREDFSVVDAMKVPGPIAGAERVDDAES